MNKLPFDVLRGNTSVKDCTIGVGDFFSGNQICRKTKDKELSRLTAIYSVGSYHTSHSRVLVQ